MLIRGVCVLGTKRERPNLELGFTVEAEAEAVGVIEGLQCLNCALTVENNMWFPAWLPHIWHI